MFSFINFHVRQLTSKWVCFSFEKKNNNNNDVYINNNKLDEADKIAQQSLRMFYVTKNLCRKIRVLRLNFYTSILDKSLFVRYEVDGDKKKYIYLIIYLMAKVPINHWTKTMILFIETSKLIKIILGGTSTRAHIKNALNILVIRWMFTGKFGRKFSDCDARNCITDKYSLRRNIGYSPLRLSSKNNYQSDKNQWEFRQIDKVRKIIDHCKYFHFFFLSNRCNFTLYLV